MKEIVTFDSEEVYRNQAEEIYRKYASIIKQAIPSAEVHHVGSTAVKGSLTKGDVDLQIRVDAATFQKAQTFFDKTYEVNEGSSQTSFFRAYEKSDDNLGLQLTQKHSEVDHFWKIAQYFRENPLLTKKYNALKASYNGKDMEKYRDEKALFMKELLESDGYQKLSRRLDLLEKVKVVEGETFITIEELHEATDGEVEELINLLLHSPHYQETNTINVVISGREDVGDFLLDKGFTLHDETVTVTRELRNEIEETADYAFVSLHDGTEAQFKKVWAEAMSDSFNSASSLSIDDQLRSVEVELGADWKTSCLIAYEGNQAVGVVMPHIEPGTAAEGRLFYFGIVPSERGRGKSKAIHKQGLRLLRDFFGATSYVGNTSVRNIPMIRTFHANGCQEVMRNKVYTLRK